MLSIEMLPAYYGDALWIEYGRTDTSPRRILIDCGLKGTYRTLMRRLAHLDWPRLELLVLTHIDEDHIKGAVPFIADGRIDPDKIGDVWFNGWTHLERSRSPLQGEFFSALLQQRRFQWNRSSPWQRGPVMVPDSGPLPRIELEGGMSLTLLSPTSVELDAMREEWHDKVRDSGIDPGDHEAVLQALADHRELAPDVVREPHLRAELGPFHEDTSPANGSSIALLAEYEGRALLLAGDAHPSVLAWSLQRLLRSRGQQRLVVDALKVAHHASAHNTSPELLALLDCKQFLVSTNGSKFSHPAEDCIRRLVARSDAVTLRFNYRSAINRVWDDEALQEQLGFRALYPSEAGYRLELET